MDPERVRPGVERHVGHIIQSGFRVLIVHADTAFDRDRNGNRFLHRGNASGDNVGCLHQAGAERARLNTI